MDDSGGMDFVRFYCAVGCGGEGVVCAGHTRRTTVRGACYKGLARWRGGDTGDICSRGGGGREGREDDRRDNSCGKNIVKPGRAA